MRSAVPNEVIDGAVARAVQRAVAELGGWVDPGPVDRVQPPAMPFRRGRDDAADDTVDLTAPEHEWWVATPVEPFAPTTPPGPDADPTREPGRPPADTTAEPRGEVAPDDPYAVLRIAPSSDWDAIVSAYRKLARWYHPDGLADPSPEERAACEEMIRRLNAAYAELRVRRGR